MDEEDLYWLIGILEGEGTFVGASPSAHGIPAVRVVMTDRDVVERVGGLLRRSVMDVAKREDHHKTPYVTVVKGTPAVELMRLIEPAMSSARRQQIARVIGTWHGRAARWRAGLANCAVDSCDRRAIRRGLCKRHYDHWWEAKRDGRPTIIQPQAAPPYVVATSAVEAANGGERALWWLAGLVEGEGCFSIMRSDGHCYPVLTVNMCSEDVIQQVARIIGAPSVTRQERDELNWRPTYVTRLVGSAAAEWMRTLRPLMGERRGAAIDAALAAYQPIRLVVAPETCVVTGCDAPHRGRGLCHKHYMMWMRDRRSGRTPRVVGLR